MIDTDSTVWYTMGMTCRWNKIKHDPEAAAEYRTKQNAWRAAKRAGIAVAPRAKQSAEEKAAKSRQARIKQQNEDRLAVFSRYGSCCCRCGEADPMVLTIDHENQDGHSHKPGNRKNRISGYILYRWLVKNNFPSGYRTACANCQIRFYREDRR